MPSEPRCAKNEYIVQYLKSRCGVTDNDIMIKMISF